MMGELVILARSVCHPHSNRLVRHAASASALEIALQSGLACHVIYFGSASDQACLDYAGMGPTRLTAIERCADEVDLAELATLIAGSNWTSILVGSAFGERGMMPYRLALKLGVPLVSDVSDLSVNLADIHVLRQLSWGFQQHARYSGSAVIVIPSGAAEPRLPARAVAKRTPISTVPIAGRIKPCSESVLIRRSRISSMSLKQPTRENSGSSRLTSFLPSSEKQGTLLTGLNESEAAKRVFAWLVARGIGDGVQLKNDREQE